MPKKDTIAQRVAKACAVSDQYVRDVVSDKKLRHTRVQKKVVHTYCMFLQERIDELRASILHEAINDFN
jgi:hypothetical protein